MSAWRRNIARKRRLEEITARRHHISRCGRLVGQCKGGTSLRWGAFLCLWQKDRENHQCDEPLAREARKPRQVSKLMDDQARKCRTEGGTDTRCRAKHALRKIKASSTLRYIGDDQRRHHAQHGPRNTVE